jgi:hypothetical protein
VECDSDTGNLGAAIDDIKKEAEYFNLVSK